MNASRRAAQGHPTAPGRGLLAVALIAGACAAPSARELPELAATSAPEPGALRVRLLFGADADLDLFVTDPRQETVYFANTPSLASGGALDADRRCDAPAPRVETVTFAAPPAGRYRVGVDYPERCGAGRAPAAYRVAAEAQGWRQERAGTIEFGRFDPAVLEFDWEP